MIILKAAITVGIVYVLGAGIGLIIAIGNVVFT